MPPAWLAGSPLERLLQATWNRRPRQIALLSAAVIVACWIAIVPQRPWELHIPATAQDAAAHRGLLYPAGAVEYLRQQHFHGNVMTPFTSGAYVSWYLYPAVKVSLDGRYEVAYQPGVFERVQSFYAAQPGWQATLTQYPTDLVLTPAHAPVARLLPVQTPWQRVYHDGLFELFARPGLHLPEVDRTGQVKALPFPVWSSSFSLSVSEPTS